jgi:L-fuculose-phosphate aldolase
MAEIDDVKREVVIANRMLFEMGLADGPTIERGHASMRLPGQPDRFVIKGLGPALSLLEEGHLVVCDLEGFKTDGPKELNLPNEVKMHSCILREHPEVQSVVHVHPRFTVLMSVLQANIRPMCIEGMAMFRDPLPVFPFPRLIIREEDGAEVAKLMGGSKAILLQGHGAATAGADLEEAVMNMLNLEEQARMNYYAYTAMGPDHPSITKEQMADFGANMRKLAEQAHLKPEVAPTSRKPSGVWRHYEHRITGR